MIKGEKIWYSHPVHISVPPEPEIRCIRPPKAFCVHSNIGAVKTAPVQNRIRRDSKEASFTVPKKLHDQKILFVATFTSF